MSTVAGRIPRRLIGTDLVDNKTLTFSDTEYGVRLVVRKHLRARGPERSA